jgi:hypothetical protein
VSERFPVCNAEEAVRILRRHAFGMVSQNVNRPVAAARRNFVVDFFGSFVGTGQFEKVCDKVLDKVFPMHGRLLHG